MLIVNTLSPDHHDPSQACLLQGFFDFGHIPVFDLRAQCTGLIYGMDIANQYIKSGTYQNIMVVCGEVLSKRMDYSDDGRNLSILLGDGAGAVILGASNNSANTGIKDTLLRADGKYFKLLWTESPGSKNRSFNEGIPFFRMNGKPMFDHATSCFIKVINEILNKHQLKKEDIDVIIPHQPNLRILDHIIESLQLDRNKVVINVDQLGNMASASLPVTLSLARLNNKIKPGDLCLIVGYGSGATWGATLYQN